MKESPPYPLILCDKSGYLDLIHHDDNLAHTNVLGFLKGAYLGFTAYDNNGTTWTVKQLKTTYKINGLTRLLAYTIYNPIIKVTFQWKKGKGYQLDRLKQQIAEQIDKDDDVLTQYEDGEVIKQDIQKCESFSDIIIILNKYIFQVNEKELLPEQGLRK